MTDTLTVISKPDDTLDGLIWRELGAGPEVLQTVLDLNPGAVDFGLILPAGTPITLPRLVEKAVDTRDIVQLWS